MSDLIDNANDTAEFLARLAIAERKPEPRTPMGVCAFCGDDDIGEQRFCDVKCRDKYERRVRG